MQPNACGNACASVCCHCPSTPTPYLYRISDRVPGLREIVAHPNYLVLYRVTATCIEIVNVVHARREFP